jgi:hypothetical protein
MAGTGRLLGRQAQAAAGGISASTPTAEDAVKLICRECRRVVDVRQKDLDKLGICVECWRPLMIPPEHEEARHLVCPFCTIEGNGIFWLQRLKDSVPATKQGEAA